MRAEVFGVPLDLLSMDQSVDRCVALVEAGIPSQHVVINAGKVVMADDVAGLRAVIRDCAIVNADGQSVVWAGRFLGLDVPERVAGIDLMGRLLREAEIRGWPVYFLGARAEVLATAVATTRRQHPRLVVAGSHHGYFGDDAGVAAAVRDSGARLLLVGMPSPRKEFFLAQRLHEMGPVLAVGVGGSFDVVAGVVVRAPAWMQKAGLEWLYRLGQEPRRMWRRYIIGNIRFVAIVLRERRDRLAGR
jgi:N-acetylglucosaminyldiphosphoundecaprenol N-acetyl-beta-D-mannosaminyltransferase